VREHDFMGEIFTKQEYKKLRQDLRVNSTKAEDILWVRLRRKQLNGFKFRRQHSIGRYIVDFYCKDLALVIELDGSHHDEDNQVEYDNIRTEYFKRLGINELRFKNFEASNDLNNVLEKIKSSTM
jgi:very-short-patch-repair endonuclease